LDSNSDIQKILLLNALYQPYIARKTRLVKIATALVKFIVQDKENNVEPIAYNRAYCSYISSRRKKIDNHGAYTLSLPPMHKGNEKQYKQVDPNSKQ
jgi:hypothetical protein